MCVRPGFNGKSAAIGDDIVSVNGQVVFRCNVAYINGSNFLNRGIEEVRQTYDAAPAHEIDDLDPVRAIDSEPCRQPWPPSGRLVPSVSFQSKPRGYVLVEEEDVAGEGRGRRRKRIAGADARRVPRLASRLRGKLTWVAISARATEAEIVLVK